MSEFTLYSLETAPEGSKPLLEEAKKSMGSIPNLFAVMADAPSVLEAYLTLNRLFNQSRFNANEQTVLWQTINVEHECT